MTFLQSLESCFRQYTVWRGRASRSEYVWFYLFGFICGVGFTLLDSALGITPFTFLLLVLILLLPSLAVMARRLHDCNYSTEWMLLAFVPYVNFIFALCLLFVKGDTAANRFGEPPSA